MEKLSWTAVRRGPIYCAPACGAGCTAKAYLEAKVASATLVALGTATVYTPRTSGRVLVLMSAIAANGTTTDGMTYNLYYGTGAAPANNDAVSGTAICSLQTITSLVMNELSTSVSLQGIVANLVADKINSLGQTVAGTAYWFDVMFSYVTGGTVTFTDVNMSVIEF